MFNLNSWYSVTSSKNMMRVCGAISSVILTMTAVHPTNAFPKLSDPTITSPAQSDEAPALTETDIAMERYLNKLMMAESAGKPTAKNPRSTALGPFQFINSTFLAVVDRDFSDHVDGLNENQILALRTDMEFSRRAAIAFNNDNATYLESRGVKPTFAHMRLSHLLGPAGAAQALRSHPSTRLTKIFSAPVIRANPFMARLTVAGLVERAEREVGTGLWKVSSQVAQAATDFSSVETKPTAVSDDVSEQGNETATTPVE